MSRSSYSDEFGDDFPGQLALFRANVRRSMRSKKGQARLRELHSALLALPQKSLEYETFADGTPDDPRVCALGAWALNKCGGDPVAAKAIVSSNDCDDSETADILASHGWPRLVVMEAIYWNDQSRRQTPEDRYASVLRWVEKQIADTPATE